MLREVRLGHEVTITCQTQPVAVIKPVKSSRRPAPKFQPIGSGLWADRQDLSDVYGWIRKIRRPRYAR